MAYDPAVASFIIVGVVGGLAAFLNASSDWEVSTELSRATDGWTAPVVTRRYGRGASARERISKEAEVLGGHGYRPALRRTTSGEVMPGGVADGVGPGAPGVLGARAEPEPDETILVTYQLSEQAGDRLRA